MELDMTFDAPPLNLKKYDFYRDNLERLRE